jgi:hypothetical protein
MNIQSLSVLPLSATRRAFIFLSLARHLIVYSAVVIGLAANSLPLAAATSPNPKPVVTANTMTATNIIYDGPDNEAIKDLRQALEGYKAGEIKIEKVDLGTRTGQEFYLERKKEKTLIKYTVGTSLENAIYTLLDRWGFHWYGPGENWFVKPAAITGADIAGQWARPTFRNRGFFGTGGLDVPPPNDPKNQYKTDWYAWKRRNRFNSDFAGVGHGGQAFYLENKELLDKHPEWFNSEAGKQSGRIKIENAEAVAAYKAWVKKKYGASTQPFIVIGVEPEDGRGGSDDPLPPDGFAGLDKWNHADKWWWLANEVAKDYPEDDSHIVASMYAYGDGPTNALAPRFKLRKNVYPIIVPYAFQTAYLPQEMVKVWASKINGSMGLYDYWNITQWSQGLPQFNLYGMKNKLKFWHDNKVDGLYMETTDAAGPMGHSWWIAGQLQFDLNQDFNAVYNQYLTDLFGKAAPAMKQMYDRWSNNPQGAGEVSLSLADLRAADALVPRNGPQWKRINELKAYVHFMKLYYRHDGTQESKNRLFEYLYSIHHLFMVQTSAFMGQWYISPLDKGNVVPTTLVKSLTDEEIDAQFQSDLVSHPKKYDVVNFQFDHAKAKYTEPANKSAWRFGRNPTAYFVPKTAGTISFDAGNEGGDTKFTIFTDDGIILNDAVGTGNFDYTDTVDGRTWHMKRYTLKVDAGKTYYARFRGGFNRFKMNSDIIVYNAHSNDDFDNYAYPTHYFYVPKSCTEIIFEDGLAAHPDGTVSTGAFYAPGETLTKDNYGTPVGIKGLYRVAVKPEWKGKVIACSCGHTCWSLKNLRYVLSLQRFDYAE